MTHGNQIDTDKIEWDTPCPPPIIGATDVELGDPRVPKTAAQLSQRAEKAGLAVRITFAKGTYRTSTTSRIVESVAVRMQGEHTRGVGLWLDGSFNCGIISTPRRFEKVNSNELKEWVNSNA